MDLSPREHVQAEFYRRYRSRTGANRNDLRNNPGVLFQDLAFQKSLVRVMTNVEHDPANASVLDVGCGTGGDLCELVKLGYLPDRITGIDILQERIDKACLIYPNARFIHCDAASTGFEDNTFDLVFESTMFATLTDHDIRKTISSEMVRVCKPGGYLVLVDWRFPKLGDRTFKALTKRQVNLLFGLDSFTRLIQVSKGALIPPIGRFLSARAPSIYFLVCAIMPFLIGQIVYLLQKNV